MRFGLLAVSIAMLMSGGVAVQSALAISTSATATIAAPQAVHVSEAGDKYGSLPFTADRTEPAHLAMR